jgi:transposase
MTPHQDACLAPPPPATPTCPQSPVLSDALQVCHPHAAGIDLGAAEPWGAVPPGGAPPPVRRFGPFPVDLDALADWRMDGGVTTVAMASTGVDWRPLCARLETRGIQGLRLEPRHATRAPGRPHTDRLDGQWRHRLHAYGRLAGACRPAEQVGVLRRALRPRPRLRTAAAHPRQHRPTALPQRPRTLPQGVSALTGVTGRGSIKAIVAGARAPVPLAPLRHPPGQHDEDDIAKALQGPWRAEPLVA